MNSQLRAIAWSVWGFLAVIILSVVGVFISSNHQSKGLPLPVWGQVPDFKLTNQLGKTVSLSDLAGSVWVADIIFTRCPGPCLQMTRKMKAIQTSLPANSPVKLISLTADPAYDNTEVLNLYANRNGADSARWQFLTGPKLDVYGLAMNGLKLAVQENPQSKIDEDQFIHSTRFVLIDRKGRLRGASYDGTEAQTVPDILRAAQQLARED